MDTANTGRPHSRPLALVTGASTGIGLELAHECAGHGFDLIVVADEARIADAAADIGGSGADVEPVEADLSTVEGCERVLAAVGGRPVDALLANAGRGLGHAFVDQEWVDIRRVIDTNVTGTVYLVHRIARDMRARGSGRILLTGSIAGYLPGTYQAVYNASKAFVDLFSYALRAELKDSGVTVTCLMPGATETEFFDRADLRDTRIGQADKDDPVDVAEAGFKAMMDGEADVVAGWRNKVQVALARVTPATVLAEQHRKQAAPGSAGEASR